MYMHAYTLYSAVRPYGCAAIMGSWSEHEGPQMYMLEPSGVSFVSVLILYVNLIYKNLEKEYVNTA